ncbi:MAG: bifunctional diaminohydroxyphosphoribosylaminopyrimidine deaminase/5-amino-6-(5-phosphoribosylamino)uracil reductase RibD [Bacteroidales bacterium]|nr:bifunctional diaminohydroxyphosphoribosylaminopyrimidine deaminase/5-amino-6-(5-phosphoribosylamino)uracil reductase RibD [Bacteroidales bacterium]
MIERENTDLRYMRRCLQLAAAGLGRTRPNPLVGCVVADANGVISEGFHQLYGQNHAERNALLRAGSCKGATLYVNLEPCSHHGLTPPCADIIIEKGIAHVVCCNDDPNPLVSGRGFARLEAAGIEVVRHVLEAEGRELNRRFFTFMEQRRPYVILKWAQSSDGFMAPAQATPYWLTTPRQDRLNHRWRTEEAAIVVGSETYLLDRPALTPRHYLGPAPLPVVMDRRGRIGDAELQAAARDGRPAPLVLRSASVAEALHELYERKVQSVIVEGGRQLLEAFIASGLYDEVRILRSPKPLGSGLKAPEIPPVKSNRLIVI